MDYSATRAKLIKQRNELLSRVSRLHKDLHHRDEPYARDFAEQVVELENLEVLFELDRESRESLKLINEALYRLDHECYDICSRCGETIAAERLKALPYTDLCIDCAEAQQP